MTTPLSVRVRTGTRADHDAAQGSGFLDRLSAGQLPIEAYADLTAQHHAIYEVLERAATVMADDPDAAAFVLPELTRLPSLESDLEHLYGPDWRTRAQILPATAEYRERLTAVAFDSAPRFVAHHYTRYLGDLSGGQYLGSAIAKSYGLNGFGHRFFVFEGVAPPAMRTRYRELLDAAPWGDNGSDAFLAEVPEAYRLNIEVLRELKERWAE